MFRAGSFRLLQFAGIDVYVHWTWLVVAVFQVHFRAQLAGEESWPLPVYDSPGWYWIEYVALFTLVLLHEFGHALVCRRVGGFADHIVLWPLGGIALVRPPLRPAALLGTAIAGPLVNVVLLPLLGGLYFLAVFFNWSAFNADLPVLLATLFWLDVLLLAFNLLPVFPMDGGQILHGLLWFPLGRADSLAIVSVIGMTIGSCMLPLTLLAGPLWGLMAGFLVYVAYAGYRQSRIMARVLNGPRRSEAACPSCGVSPLVGDYWTCDECGTRFDTFGCRAQCPGCGKLFRMTRCPECYQQYSIGEWFAAPSSPPREDFPDYAPR